MFITAALGVAAVALVAQQIMLLRAGTLVSLGRDGWEHQVRGYRRHLCWAYSFAGLTVAFAAMLVVNAGNSDWRIFRFDKNFNGLWSGGPTLLTSLLIAFFGAAAMTVLQVLLFDAFVDQRVSRGRAEDREAGGVGAGDASGAGDGKVGGTGGDDASGVGDDKGGGVAGHPWRAKLRSRSSINLSWFIIAAMVPVLVAALTEKLPVFEPSSVPNEPSSVSNEADSGAWRWPLHSEVTAGVLPAAPLVALSVSVSLSVMLGLTYAGWVAVAVFRRLTKEDRLVGKDTLRFLKNPWDRFLPVQACVIGPRRAGKTNICIAGFGWNDHPERQRTANKRPGTTSPRQFTNPTLYRQDDRSTPRSVTVIDPPGEMLGTHIDLLFHYRVDCLVVVVDLKQMSMERAADREAWTLDVVARLFDTPGPGDGSVDDLVKDREYSRNYFTALHLLLKFRGRDLGSKLPIRVRSVLVVATTGVANGADASVLRSVRTAFGVDDHGTVLPDASGPCVLAASIAGAINNAGECTGVSWAACVGTFDPGVAGGAEPTGTIHLRSPTMHNAQSVAQAVALNALSN